MKSSKRVLYRCALIAGIVAGMMRPVRGDAPQQQIRALRDGAHDFDFEIGTWRTHLKRLVHPLTGATTWIEMDGVSTVRKVWDGRANLVELHIDTPKGPIQILSLRLYNPESHQWSLNVTNANGGVLGVPTVGEFKNGRGEFYDQEAYNGRAILVRFVISDITQDSCRFEQAFSADGGKTWETNWIATDTRVPDETAADASTGGSMYSEFVEPQPQAQPPTQLRLSQSPSSQSSQSMDDAWWTGPMLANTAATLPCGHCLVEPYVYDVVVGNSNGFSSRTYVLYGLVDRFTVGVIPVAGFNEVNGGLNSSQVALGDVTVMGQYGLTRFSPERRIPTTAIEVQEAFPTGKYDELGSRPIDGLGAGAYTTTVSLNSQTYFSAPNGRIVRMRLNAWESFSTNATVTGVSVYGTDAAFRGHAKPGKSTFIDWSWEYSVRRSWVLALDMTYGYNGNTRVAGSDISSIGLASPVRLKSGWSDSLDFAPAAEYSWKSNLGFLLGVHVLAMERNVAAVTPAIAINYVR